MATTGLQVSSGPNASNILHSGQLEKTYNNTAKTKSKFNWAGLGNTLASGASFLGTMLSPSALGETADTSGEEAAMENIGGSVSNMNNYDSLQDYYQQANNTSTSFNWQDWRPTSEQKLWGTVGETLQGAQAGMNFGNSLNSNFGNGAGAMGYAGAIGAGIGGAVNMIKSLVSSARADKEAQARQAELHELGEQKKNEAREKVIAQSQNVMANTRDNALLNIAAEGGPLYNNPNFSNGVRNIEEGGSHEQNPLGGVPQGIAQDGIPNLVEEGEVIFDDYVFSKRLKVPNSSKEMLGLKKNKEYTFAEAANKIQEESEERTNDPISKKNLKVMMGRLQEAQEELKAKQEQAKLKKQLAKLSPQEQIALLAQLQGGEQQPQQQQMPMQEQQAIPQEMMMPQQGFARGGHLFSGTSKFGNNSHLTFQTDFNKAINDYIAQQTFSLPYTYVIEDPEELVKKYPLLYGQDWIMSKENPVNKYGRAELGIPYKVKKTSEYDPNASEEFMNGMAQFLRVVPVMGTGIAALKSLADTPHYTNIERAERAALSIPPMEAPRLGNRMAYNPIDVNYLANAMNNTGLSARRAIQEQTLGNRAAAMQATLANNYATQTALANAYIQAQEANQKQRQAVDAFNRETDTQNGNWRSTVNGANTELALKKAETLYNTGILRDTELQNLQATRGKNLSSFYTNIGNLGKDLLARDQVNAGLESGVYGTQSDPMKQMAANTVAALGGLIYTKKKGGKHA